MGEMRNAYNILGGKSESKKPLERPRRRWEENIRIYIRETRWEVVYWAHMAEDKDQWRGQMNTVVDLRVP